MKFLYLNLLFSQCVRYITNFFTKYISITIPLGYTLNMKMNEACKQTNLTKKAIHYYIDCDLVHVKKLENNYYDFSDENIEELKQIAFFRKMGISIETIKKIFSSPTALNFFLVEERNKLYLKAKEQLNELLNLTSLILSLPHNATPVDLPQTIPNSQEIVNTLFAQIPQDLNYRMLSIYIFSAYTDEFATEYKRYLWKKIETEVQKQFQATSVEALDYFSIHNDGEKMLKKYSHDFKTTLALYEASNLEPIVEAFINKLKQFLNTGKAIIAWNLHYQNVYVPTLNAYQTCAKEVLKEFSNRFAICNKKIEQIILLTDQHICNTNIKKDLYDKCNIDDENYGTSLFLLFLYNPIDYIV